MKRAVLLICLMALVFAAAVNGGDEAPWFDMENCAFCVNLMDPPEMIQSLEWEHYPISNGLVSVSTVPEKYADAYEKAMGMMKETSERMAKGEKLHTCGMCTAMGALFAKGAKTDYVKTKHGFVTVMTSDSPEVVAEIQAWGKRTTEELAKMEDSMSEGDMGEMDDMHEGHDH